jgi:hypothetical protein
MCWTSRRISDEFFEDGDEWLEMGKGEDGNILLVFDNPLLPGNGVQALRDFETTRCMWRSGGGFVVARRSVLGVRKQRTRGTLEIIRDLINHGIESGRACPAEDL